VKQNENIMEHVSFNEGQDADWASLGIIKRIPSIKKYAAGEIKLKFFQHAIFLGVMCCCYKSDIE